MNAIQQAVVDSDGLREWLEVRQSRARSRKLCPGCGDVKDVEDFARNKARHDGREGICKECDGTRPRRGQVRAVDGAA